MTDHSNPIRGYVARVTFGAVAVAAIIWWQTGPRDADAKVPSVSVAASNVASLAADTIRFIEHPETLPIGWPSNDKPLVLENPFERDAKALATGAQLYIAYNCIDCHGAGGGGAMGPSLADGRWHSGGRPDQIFESIYQGRPSGMPAWGGRIANDQIWMLVTYVRSLNGGRDLSTENFTGRTVERTGH